METVDIREMDLVEVLPTRLVETLQRRGITTFETIFDNPLCLLKLGRVFPSDFTGVVTRLRARGVNLYNEPLLQDVKYRDPRMLDRSVVELGLTASTVRSLWGECPTLPVRATSDSGTIKVGNPIERIGQLLSFSAADLAPRFEESRRIYDIRFNLAKFGFELTNGPAMDGPPPGSSTWPELPLSALGLHGHVYKFATCRSIVTVGDLQKAVRAHNSIFRGFPNELLACRKALDSKVLGIIPPTVRAVQSPRYAAKWLTYNERNVRRVVSQVASLDQVIDAVIEGGPFSAALRVEEQVRAVELRDNLDKLIRAMLAPFGARPSDVFVRRHLDDRSNRPSGMMVGSLVSIIDEGIAALDDVADGAIGAQRLQRGRRRLVSDLAVLVQTDLRRLMAQLDAFYLVPAQTSPDSVSIC